MKVLMVFMIAAVAFLFGVAVDRAILHPWGSGDHRKGQVESLDPDVSRGAGAFAQESGGAGVAIKQSEQDQETGGGDREEERGERAEWRRFQEALGAATAESIGELAASLRGAAERSDEGHGRLMGAYRRWAELDPAAALTAAMREPNDRLRRSAVHTLFRTLAERDLGSAQRMLASVADPNLRREAIHAMSDIGGRQAPEAFARFLEGLPDGRDFGHFFRDWAGRDPSAAAGFVLSVGDAAARSEWIRGVASGWASGDAEGAAAWVESLGGTADFWPAAEMLVEEMARTDPAAAAALVSELPAGDRRRHLIERVSSSWARQDLEAALTWAESQPGFQSAAALDPLLREWTGSDPAAAAAYVGNLPVSERTLRAAHHLAEQWGNSDPEAAMAWALAQEDPALRDRAMHGALSAWAEQDLNSAADFAASLEDSSELRNAVRAVAEQWAVRDPAGAMDWVEALPAGVRGEGGREILNHLAREDPRAAAGFYEALTSGGLGEWGASEPGLFVDAAGDIAGRWSELLPAEAADWATGLPEGEAQARAIGAVADRWVWADSLGASEWIGSLPAGEIRDVAAERLVNHIASSDPAAAFQWALSVEAEGRRLHLTRRVLDRWTSVDPGAAQSALDASGLSPDQRARVEPQ
ncbi:MAG TPA: hypothetical protein VMN36_17030 [Verrucomicrobiales bacterium]|nr:hypothetical protein [Verrucomicrobiales bacterium]